MKRELAPRVNPKDYENSTYQFWLENKLFHANENSTKPPYSIVIPPPNVTGALHIGHALNNTIQDILIRFHKLKGYETMWIPGTDHGGIATQTVVERKLISEGKTRHDLGRDAFIDEVWRWKEESGNAIISQLKALGSSCDWDRERFTMDEELSKVVRKIFVDLYKEGLIYRSQYLINWCVHCHTALSDLEVEFEERNDFLYHMKYPLANGQGFVEIATTRPETYLADSAVAVNPNDERYSYLIGKNVILPIINREIPIIGDEYVDIEFGTGCLKVTPAHDPNDFEIGRKHNLPEYTCIDQKGYITVDGLFKGLYKDEARKKVVEKFRELGLMGNEEHLKHSVGHCYRCHTVVEPLVSLQWFVNVKPLAEKAIEAVEKGETKIVPKIWENSYFEWMNNIRDWCISRQIWWGHRIPAWHCKSCGHITVSESDPDICEKCKSANIYQETDVLDTWFSSALWPFSTMGWPEKNKTLEKFYPTSVLVTGFDILFFWVARMMMMGIKFMGSVPFKDTYIHALVRDQYGEKMSKTKGNVIDPLLMIDKYGADAMRFSLAAFAAQGRDIRLSEDRIEGYRNFVNKIWNATRFLFMNMENEVPKINEADLRDEDKWILSKLSEIIVRVDNTISSYEFNEAASALYNFFWMNFCDWYVELIKDRLYKNDEKKAAVATAAYVLEKAMIAMHPFMPFITEHIWQHLVSETEGIHSIMCADYPKVEYNYPEAEKDIDHVIELIGLIRNIRGEYNINPGATLPVYVVTTEDISKTLFESKSEIIRRIAKISEVHFTTTAPDNSASQVSINYSVYIPLSGLVNVEAEIAKLKKEMVALEKDYDLYSGKLKNERYLQKASLEVIEKDRKKVAEIENQILNVKKAMENLG